MRAWVVVSRYVCMYVCLYGCMYVCMYVCVYVYACMPQFLQFKEVISMFVCMHVCMYVCMFEGLSACTYGKLGVYVHGYLFLRISRELSWWDFRKQQNLLIRRVQMKQSVVSVVGFIQGLRISLKGFLRTHRGTCSRLASSSNLRKIKNPETPYILPLWN